ncbi:MAG: T9SS type A sorting domain-containing protein [Candidatus Electryonea clarkiae]|nr:T9SS type A sorting domain-containing protein [Candidatus Electryonea clarkiae]MDP8287231.1 T9SS type A sorting domain-containing protein [Candidatus Electryonea clarkiae]
MDIIGAATTDNDIAWWENDGDQDFTEHTISGNYNFATHVHVGDIDDDNDIDIVSAGQNANKITWWENSLHGAPKDFCLLSPQNNLSIDETNITFSWLSAEDDDPDDVVTYVYYLSTDEEFSDPTIIETDTDTSLIIDALSDDTHYWWKVHAEDNDSDGKWCEAVFNFEIYIPEAPEPFDLISPENGISIHTLTHLFEWEDTNDPDPDDAVTFRLFLSTNPEFDYPRRFYAGSETNLEAILLEEDATYWWKVLAQDMNTAGTWSSQTRTLSVDRVYPPDDLEADLNQSSGVVSLSWQAGSDGGDDLDDLIDYKVFRDESLIGRTVDKSYDDQLEQPGNHVYIYHVTAQFSDGESEASNTIEVQWSAEGIPQITSQPVPTKWSIASAYPNPFNPTLTVVIGLPEQSSLKVEVLNVEGRRVALIADGTYSAGYNRMIFNADEFTSGIYFVHAVVPSQMNEIQKVLLVK